MPETILVAVDDSPDARKAVEQAVGLAHRLGAGIRLMTVVVTPMLSLGDLDASQAESLRARFRAVGERLLRSLAPLAEARGVPVDTRYVEGVPADEILAEAGKGCLLLVIGARGAGLAGRDRSLLGSVTDRILRQSPIPVLLVPSPRP
jgi:nucleotide-binding universal stress UspA family protein